MAFSASKNVVAPRFCGGERLFVINQCDPESRSATRCKKNDVILSRCGSAALLKMLSNTGAKMGKKNKRFELEPAPIVLKPPRKTPQGFQNLIIRYFPDDLMEQCKQFSGQVCGSKAVLDTLQKFFEILPKYKKLELEHKYLESDFRELRDLLYQEQEFQRKKESLLEHKKERFRLYGD